MANAANKAVVEQMKASALRRSAREKGEAEQLAKQFEGLALHFSRRAGESDQLFGSVTSSDIAHELENRGFNVDRRKIEVAQAIKNVGEYTIHIKLHREVSVPVKVTVTKEAEEVKA
jgi:large subunit ribosomal protein L9